MEIQTNTTQTEKHSRPLATVQPLATDLNITVDVSCDRDDTKCVADVVDGYLGAGNILVCWEHHALTDIVEALGDKNAPRYDDDAFDIIWTDPKTIYCNNRDDIGELSWPGQWFLKSESYNVGEILER
ncbi:hypothetical protein DID88_002560 [Monilinia fructigena]|uniref:Uncharacterized protein n=1 Tax=Monilinia fructigena TaxID=38457 RepID=A0A395IQA1_9HELO|nr:hypothetical protein DID88_002560 [Monilinia fructigena]